MKLSFVIFCLSLAIACFAASPTKSNHTCEYLFSYPQSDFTDLLDDYIMAFRYATSDNGWFNATQTQGNILKGQHTSQVGGIQTVQQIIITISPSTMAPPHAVSIQSTAEGVLQITNNTQNYANIMTLADFITIPYAQNKVVFCDYSPSLSTIKIL
eukprot:TRINITY_DN54443_c0_g1_i1.p1 TRINITY_DN54443_c0_g1~~TRINITY_DN54443_c0_g1_i1.p1  ORF type:complete len:156 (-),score=9.64 TRINITY_DN54443_c0_g1_i1:80-547(-)